MALEKLKTEKKKNFRGGLAKVPSGSTHPAKAGEINMPNPIPENMKMKDGISVEFMGALFERGIGVANASLAWTAELAFHHIKAYFDWVAENQVKPSKAGLRVWLGVSVAQYWQWESKPSKFGTLNAVIRLANDVIEASYIQRSEKYPTANVFLLKSSHGHRETLNVATEEVTSKEEVRDIVARLGFGTKEDLEKADAEYEENGEEDSQ